MSAIKRIEGIMNNGVEIIVKNLSVDENEANKIISDLEAIAVIEEEAFDLDNFQIDLTHRLIDINVDGTYGKSKKIRNILKWESILAGPLAIAGIPLGGSIVGVIIAALGIIVTYNSLSKVEIDQRTALVVKVLWNNRSDQRGFTLDKLLETTNEMLKKYELSPISSRELTTIALRLEKINSLKIYKERYFLIEDVVLKHKRNGWG